MKRKALFLLALFQSFVVYAQIDFWDEAYPGVPLVIGVDSDIWSSRILRQRTDNNVTRRLLQGERVLGEQQSSDPRINDGFYHVTRIKHSNDLYAIRTGNLLPAGNGRLPRDWITPSELQWRIVFDERWRVPPAHKRWVISYYLDVLRSQNRDTFLKYEKAYIDWLLERERGTNYPGDWYEGTLDYESLIFFDAVIIMGGLHRHTFFIMDISPFSTGYKITMSGDKWFALYETNPPALPFPRYSERQNFDMIFIPDGDFMDVYLDTLDNHFASFAKVDTAVLEELHALVETNIVDLSRIVWPRRADGTMDFPPPVVSSNAPAQQVVDESIEIIYDIEDQESAVVQNDTSASSMPLWVWLAIIGGVVVAGGVLVVVVRRKG
jgi:hypothetical protein